MLSEPKMSSYQIKHILLVEENPCIYDLMLKTWGNTSNQHKVHWVKNTQDALNFLYQKGNYVDSPRPQLIVIDVNSPALNERDFLQTIKSDSSLKFIPVVVLTNSENQEEIFNGYQLSANSYVTKPLALDDLSKVIERLGKFWLNFVQLP
jgi:chemotaxis family two-component system response regulator Rcp1